MARGVIAFYSNKVPKYAYLSQFFPCRFFDENGNEFNSAEKYMHYKKAVLFGDDEIAQKILNSSSPPMAKILGRKIKNFDSSQWDRYKYMFVYNGNYLKFISDPELKRKLLSTERRLIVEASPTDLIWGAGLSHNDPKINNPRVWKGQNLLGKVLMNVRSSMKHC